MDEYEGDDDEGDCLADDLLGGEGWELSLGVPLPQLDQPEKEIKSEKNQPEKEMRRNKKERKKAQNKNHCQKKPVHKVSLATSTSGFPLEADFVSNLPQTPSEVLVLFWIQMF